MGRGPNTHTTPIEPERVHEDHRIEPNRPCKRGKPAAAPAPPRISRRLVTHFQKRCRRSLAFFYSIAPPRQCQSTYVICPPPTSHPPSIPAQVLVDFTASWCGPCKKIGPYFEELATKYPDVIFVKIDVDDLDDVAAECGISAMPTFQLYSNGVKVQEMTGADETKLAAMAAAADDM